MNCDQFRRQMDDLVGGYLGEAERHAAERHASSCAACREELEGLEELRNRARRLSTALSPERDLWSGILARIDLAAAKPRMPAQRLWLAVAALLAVAVVTLPLLLQNDLPATGRQVTSESGLSLVEPDATRATAELARYEDRVLLTREDLVEAIEMRRDLLGPKTYQAVEDSLRVLDQAVSELRLAMEENPDDRRLHLLLAATYQHEVRLLQRVSRV
jgi:hypothetical protein